MKQNFQKQFLYELKAISPYGDMMQVFNDWLWIAAISMRQAAYNGGKREKDAEFEHYEAAYFAAIKPYSKEQLNTFGRMMGITGLGLNSWAGDFLGSLYMELQGEKTMQHSGQFFTPFTISEMMVKMTVPNLAETIAEKGYTTVSEPASGGGGMLIALAKHCQEQRIDPYTVFFQAIDINRTCFLMTYVQTSFLSMAGYVIHGNTLSCEQWECWPTPILQQVQAEVPEFFSEAQKIMPMAYKIQSQPKQMALF